MTQYINLYDPSLRQGRDLLSLNNVALSMVLALLVLMGLAAFGMVRSSEELRSYKIAEAKLRQAQEQLTVFAAQQAGRKQDVALQNELAEAKEALATKSDVLARLQSGEFGQREGFYPFLRALAQVEPEGVWLTAFVATNEGKAMEIRGRMVNESSLPRYVQALRRQPAFNGRQFTALNVSRVEAKVDDASGQAYIEFVLSGMPVSLPAATGDGR